MFKSDTHLEENMISSMHIFGVIKDLETILGLG